MGKIVVTYYNLITTYKIIPISLLIILVAPIVLSAIIDHKREIHAWSSNGVLLEEEVAYCIGKTAGAKAHRTIMLPRGNGDDAEIDVVCATRKGIFVTECKYRSAPVTGDINADQWGAYNKKLTGTYPMENPVRQNYYHVKAVEDYLESKGYRNLRIFNLCIVFAGLRIMNKDSMKDTVILGIDYPKTFKKYYKKLPNLLSKEEVKTLNDLFASVVGTKEQILEHNSKLIDRYGI